MTDRPPRLSRLALVGGMLAAVALAVGCEGVGNTRRSGGTNESAVGRGQALAGNTPTKKPGTFHHRVGQYVFYTDFPLDTNQHLFHELEALPEQIERELQLPVGGAVIQVFLFEDEDRYHAFLRAKDPSLPLRSAYFFAEPAKGLGLPAELQVFTWLGDRLKTDLRHELTHALLHGTLKNVPLWLDEGLAGFFEQPPSNDGVNVLHLDALRGTDGTRPTPPDMGRLEKLTKVAQMGRAEYQESWAWVHYMLRGSTAGRKVLLDYLQSLRLNAAAGTLQAKLDAAVGDPSGGLRDYLATLELPTAPRVRPVAAK